MPALVFSAMIAAASPVPADPLPVEGLVRFFYRDSAGRQVDEQQFPPVSISHR
jgi:hypothetical protein